MRHERRIRVVAVAGLVGALVGLPGVSPAEAVEYRLDVASMWDTGFVSFLRPGELKDGASGSGLNRLEASLNAGACRRYPCSWTGLSRAPASAWRRLGAPPAWWPRSRGAGTAGRSGMRCVSRAGQASAACGSWCRRYYTPYVPLDDQKLPVARFPLNFLWFHEERGVAASGDRAGCSEDALADRRLMSISSRHPTASQPSRAPRAA